MKKLVQKSLIAVTVLLGSAAPALAADAAAGKAAFAQCAICHQVGPNAQVVVGPPLNGIVGKKAASYDGFAYSADLKKLGEEGYVWNEEHLDAWLANPKAIAPASMMSLAFPGISDADQRANIIAFLKTQN
jgi:cytochrome c